MIYIRTLTDTSQNLFYCSQECYRNAYFPIFLPIFDIIKLQNICNLMVKRWFFIFFFTYSFLRKSMCIGYLHFFSETVIYVYLFKRRDPGSNIPWVFSCSKPVVCGLYTWMIIRAYNSSGDFVMFPQCSCCCGKPRARLT